MSDSEHDDTEQFDPEEFTPEEAQGFREVDTGLTPAQVRELAETFQTPEFRAGLPSEEGMDIAYTADEQDGIAGALVRCATAATKKDSPLRFRCGIQVWDADKGNYTTWRGQSWRLDAVGENVEARIRRALEIRDALESFFRMLARKGPKGAKDLIEAPEGMVRLK